MLYLQNPPSPQLHPWVRSLWYCRAPHLPHGRERVLPNGCMQIVINLSRDYLTDCGEDGRASGRSPRAILTGARARYEVIDSGDLQDIAGIVFQPGGFTGLFRERADLFFERSAALEDVWAGTDLIDRLSQAPTPLGKLATLDALLAQLFQRAQPSRSTLADQALALFRRPAVSVESCAHSVGVSERRLSQVFREQVGISPKLWCRVRRFQMAARALYRGVDVPWSDLALRCGYYDQAHFANDFRAFSGVNPLTYSAHRGPWQNHLPIS